MSLNSPPKFVARRNLIKRKDGKVLVYIGGAVPEDILEKAKEIRAYLLVNGEKIYAGDHKVNKYRKNVFIFLNNDAVEILDSNSKEVTLLLEPLF
ncbi:hypothetical protein [Sulfuracidifex tepidarius]|uniref:Uncharacterized protein n=1 Tax=Sulfuracidifex tepidarius TaxID=1294262 RepID=A0A510E433_9CREN|nr:hypothetical protein [Sulfuracidifex tepidarius]BBG27281.1 hypothetical protein IC007_1826 [Sulfuracidifex tepidarius]